MQGFVQAILQETNIQNGLEKGGTNLGTLDST